MMPEIRPAVGTILIISSTMFESQLAYSKSISVIYWCQRNGRQYRMSDKLQFVEVRLRDDKLKFVGLCRTKFLGLIGLRTRNSRTGRLALCEIWEELVSEPISQ